MSDSTIYKRNEARLLHNQQAMNDDPRPKAIRILSLLPGLNLIVPPFDPQVHGTRPRKNEKPPSMAELFDAFPDANVVLFGGAARTDAGTGSIRNQYAGLSLTTSVAITGVAAAVASWAAPTTTPGSPLARSTSASRTVGNARMTSSYYHHHSSPTASIVLTSAGDLNLKHATTATSSNATAAAPMAASRQAIGTATKFTSILHPSILQSVSGMALPFIVREQLGGSDMVANALAAFCGGCVHTWMAPLFRPSTSTVPTLPTAIRTMITSPSSLSLLSSSSVAASSSSPLLGTHTMLAVTSLTLYDAAAPYGVVATAVAGATAGAVTALVQRRQQLPSSSFVPRSALRHGAFFAIYRALYPTSAPSKNCADVHAT